MLLSQLECKSLFPLSGKLAEPLAEFLHGLVTRCTVLGSQAWEMVL